MRPLRALLAFVFAVLMGGAGAQDTLLLCRMEQRTHTKCCCKRPMAEGAQLASREAELRRAPCCTETTLTTASVPPSSGTHAILAVLAPVLLERRAPPAPAFAVADLAAPLLDVAWYEATGPPLHIRHRALLL